MSCAGGAGLRREEAGDVQESASERETGQQASLGEQGGQSCGSLCVCEAVKAGLELCCHLVGSAKGANHE